MTRVPAHGRILVLAVLVLGFQVAEAQADFLITPFLGTEFAGKTTLLDLDNGAASKHWTYGASATWLSNRILGVEADFAIVPGFFQRSSGTGQALVIGSRVTTLTGSVIAALPLSVTRDSLRPYAVGGLGLLHVTGEDLLRPPLFESGDWLGLQLGAGAIGLITNRAGVRFDLRHSRALSRDTTLRGERTSKLSFWRATFGVTLRY